ncbi:hypothetical protein [Bacillus wakoensis]|uniref:hypothetical protein n=1 Tax=Halalkalibacter wakoensis TaxID=127891 RepID=UPI000555EC07
MNDSWATLKDAKFFGKKKVGQFEQEQFTYNVAVKEAKEKEKALSKQQDSLTRLLKEWANIHELGLRKPLEKQVNEMRALCKNWNATYTKLSQTYQELGQEQIIRLQDYLSVLEQWIEAFEPLFEEVEEEVSFLKPFQECQYLFENIEGLHEFLPLEQVMEEYESLRKLDAYSFGKLTSKRAEAHIDVSHLACLQLEQAPTEMRFPSAEKLYELSSKQAWTNGLTVVAAIVFVIVLYNQDKGFVEQEAFVLSEVEEVAAEEVEVEERILEEYWPREDVERFMMAMADELSRFISGTSNSICRNGLWKTVGTGIGLMLNPFMTRSSSTLTLLKSSIVETMRFSFEQSSTSTKMNS